MIAPVFELKSVSYRYLERFDALDGLDLRVLPRESLVVLGANGCGKSTLLKMLDGLIYPSNGEVFAFGERLSEERLEAEPFRSFFRSRVGFVFQNPDVQLFSPTVREELAFGPLQLGLSAAEAEGRVADTAAMLGLSQLLERSTIHLSGGEKKKAAIASVLSMNPQVLILDEPADGLDPRSRFWLQELMGGVLKAGKTVIASTHDLAFAARVATRVVVLGEDHRIVADGPAESVLKDLELLVRVNLLHESDLTGITPAVI